MFSTLLTSDVLRIGQPATFAFESGEWFFFDATGVIQSGLNERMSNYGEIISVVRGLFSDRYIITVIPTAEVTINDWLSAFDTSWRDIGYDNIIFITVEGGTVSSQPGGISQVVPQVGDIAVSALKPILPYALLFIGAYLAITMIPVLSRRHHARSR